jgi:hypothetical protein
MVEEVVGVQKAKELNESFDDMLKLLTHGQ